MATLLDTMDGYLKLVIRQRVAPLRYSTQHGMHIFFRIIILRIKVKEYKKRLHTKTSKTTY